MFAIRDVLRQNAGTEAPLMSAEDSDAGGYSDPERGEVLPRAEVETTGSDSSDPETGESQNVNSLGNPIPEEKPVPDPAKTLANAGDDLYGELQDACPSDAFIV